MTTSGSFEDFMEQFKKRHPGEFAGNPGYLKDTQESLGKDRSPGHSQTRPVNAPQKAESVRLAAVPDRMTQAAGEDWGEVWDDTSGEAEVIE